MLAVVIGCAALALAALYGLPIAERLVPAMPHGREIAVLGLLGSAGAALYGALLLGVLHLVGVRLRRR